MTAHARPKNLPRFNRALVGQIVEFARLIAQPYFAVSANAAFLEA
jgi:hypothetical protein